MYSAGYTYKLKCLYIIEAWSFGDDEYNLEN